MATVGVTISGDWVKMSRFLSISPQILEKHVRRATIKNSLFLVKKIKGMIRARKYTKNSPITIALGKGSIALLKEKNLIDALGFELSSSFKSEVGFIKNAKTTGGIHSPPHNMQKVVLLLHEGYTIDVTPEMRAAIFMGLREVGTRRANALLKRANKKAKSNPGGAKETWRVPPRRFLTSVFKNRGIQNTVKKNWAIAVDNAYREAARG